MPANKKQRVTSSFGAVVSLALLIAVIGSGTSAQAATSSASTRSGAVVVDTGAQSLAAGIAVDPEGGVVMAATSLTKISGKENSNFEVVRLNAAGKVDPSFIRGGLAGIVTDLGGYDQAKDVSVEPDGKIVVVGCSKTSNPEAAFIVLVRYLPNGQLDPSFGSGGKVLTPVPPGSCAKTLAIQSNGSIVVGGEYLRDEGGDFFTNRALFARYLPNGQLDPSFGDNGISVIPVPGNDNVINALAVEASGAVIGAGEASSEGTTTSHAVILKLLPTGNPDPSFAAGGVLELPNPFSSLYSVGLDGNEIIASGTTDKSILVSFALLLLATSNGTIRDQVEHQMPGYDGFFDAGSQVIQSNGSIVLGSADRASITGFAADGSLAPAFGNDGTASFPTNLKNYFNPLASISSLAVDGSNNIYGLVETGYNGLAVLHWTSSGQVDHGYGAKSLRVRKASLKLRAQGKKLRLRAGPETVGLKAQLSVALSKHYCQVVKHPPRGSSVPPGITLCGWKPVGRQRNSQLHLRAQQRIPLPATSSSTRATVSVQVKTADQLYGKVLGATVKATLSSRGLLVCNNGGRYACGEVHNLG